MAAGRSGWHAVTPFGLKMIRSELLHSSRTAKRSTLWVKVTP